MAATVFINSGKMGYDYPVELRAEVIRHEITIDQGFHRFWAVVDGKEDVCLLTVNKDFLVAIIWK